MGNPAATDAYIIKISFRIGLGLTELTYVTQPYVYGRS